MKTALVRAILVALVGAGALVVVRAQPTAAAAGVDRVFAKWTTSTPGCAVGVANSGRQVLAKGYGTADLEHDVAITPDTIFEAGSVSKQFTAASVLLLAHEKKLSLDDLARKYVPELPQYSPDITVRHMLNHTSGLRDWGSVAGIAGWPRTTRVHTHAHVLEIVHHQQSLNFTPGTRWSYSNTGFNLAAIIVERVSGMSFQEFTRARLFQPLGMTHTSWRDDYTRIVKGRAVAYREHDKAFYTDMPFENVYGNGGLLTTVGDLLKWNEHFDAAPEGDPLSTVEQQQAGRFSDGRTHGYALGLFVGKYKGVREVYHSGSTAGYNAFLTRFPDQHLSVAVLCNATSAQATQYAHAVADLYLRSPERLALRDDRTKAAPTMPALSADDIAAHGGLYRSLVTGSTITIGGERANPSGVKWTFDGHGGAIATDEYGTTTAFEQVAAAKPSAHDLEAYTGGYVSDEAETELRASVEHGALVLKRRPDTTIVLKPLYADAFDAPQLGTVIFRRDATGRVIALSVSQDRVWDLRFAKVRRQK
jgi:CubicO group peptidase (beta-lactamase class C family)